MGKPRSAVCAVGLLALLALCPVRAADPIGPKHAPCTSMDLWSDLQAAIAACDALIESGELDGKDLAEALRHRGDAYFRSSQLDRAIESYNRALDLAPEWPRLLWNLGSAASALGFDEPALQALRRALEIDPTYSPAHAAISGILWRQGDADAALESLDRAIELDAGNYLARFNRASFYARLGRRNDALREWGSLLREDEAELNRTYVHWKQEPDKDFVGEVHRVRAVSLKAIGSFDEALAELQRAIDRKPGYATAVIFRSQLIRQVLDFHPRFEEALSAIDQALSIHPEYPPLVVEKATLLAEMSRQDEAREVLDRTVTMQPSADAGFFMDRSYAWEALEEYDRAQADVMAAISMSRWYLAQNVQRMEQAGYLMSWEGLDPQVAMANAIAACVRDPFC